MTYSLLHSEKIKNIGHGFIYKHNKTDAKIVYIKNKDKNKVFSIAFKTLPTDSTGVAHIMEHCVLAGSKKYPLKEPFNLLDKCTLNTYLNAITFSDKTLYPIGSTNDKDFFKLLDVYLDGVFFPLIYDKKGIFLQEGWHFNGEDINGVVYNEMKGVYSSPDSLIDYLVKKNLFCHGYGCDSGGFPDEITNLSYEEFINFHKQYYTPTNSIIYFYGDLDIEYYLNYIDTEYLSKFQRAKNFNISKSQHIIKEKIIEDTYYLDDEDFTDKNYLQVTFKLKFSLDQEKNIAFEVISNLLTENQESILKNALIKEGIYSDICSYIDDDMIEPTFTIQIEATSESDIQKFKRIVEDTITNIKIDKDEIISNFVPIEFYLKEGDFGYKPKGLFYNIVLLKDMLYNKFDFSSLDFDTIIQKAKMLDFNQLLKENLLENEDYTYCILKPTNQIKQEINKNFSNNTDQLKIYQNEQDSKENLAKIPPLAIEDIEPSILKINTDFRKYFNRPIIYNKIDTEIFYINFVFDIEKFGYNPYITLFSYLIDKVGLEGIDSKYFELQLNSYFGNYKIYNGCYDLKNQGEFLPVFTFSARILEKNLQKAILLINDIFTKVDFSNKEKLLSLIKELINKLEISYLKSGQDGVCRRSRAYTSQKYFYLETMKGIEFFNWLKGINLDQDLNLVIKELEHIKVNLFCKENLYIGCAGKEENYSEFFNNLPKLQFFKFKNIKKESFLGNISKNEAFLTSIDINYNAIVCDLNKFNFKYNGKFNILKTILDTEYIWNKIRTEGGAYGGEFSIGRDGILCLNSYSDPNIKSTFNLFYNIPEYIKKLEIDEKMLHMFKIGTINYFDKIIKDHEINEIALSRFFSGRTEDDVLQEKLDILEATSYDIKQYFEILKKGFENAFICTIGCKQDILKDRHIFNKIENL